MNKNERKDVYKTAKDNGYRQSSSHPSHQINNAGKVVKHISENRTIVDNNVYYGSKAAKDAIKGK